MGTLNAERLYALLPAIHRIRDVEQGEPLKALLALIAEQFEALEEDVEQLYDDQFIETCADWVVPYIGDLIGYRPLHPDTAAGADAAPRAEVAHTIAYRRRKGTAAMLEQLARDVTGWPARAVEFFEQLATTQYMKHPRLHAPASADLRSLDAMLRLGGPFNRTAHTAEMRSPEKAAGRYNIPNIGIFLWRLQAFALTNIPLTPDLVVDAAGAHLRFNPLGADQPLFRLAQTETEISHIAEPANVPEPIGLRLMARDPALDYGPGRSVVLLRPAADPALPPVPVDIAEICICDLRDIGGGAWAHEDLAASTHRDRIALDPERGRVLLGADVTGPILACYHYGFSRAMAGGEYERRPDGDELALQVEALEGEALQPQLDAIAGGGRLLIGDSLSYVETPVFKVDGVTAGGEPGLEVVVSARSGARPLIAAGGTIALEIGPRGTLVLEGLIISGATLALAAAADDEPRTLVLRDCTLVPGLAPSLTVANAFATVRLERCISGALRADGDASLTLLESIVDAGAEDAIAFEGVAAGSAGAELTAVDCTIVGKVGTRLMRLASNTLFVARLAATGETWAAPVLAERKQEGCVRFCFVPPGSLLPRRFHCLPDETHPDALPLFTSLRYGDPGYAQLLTITDRAIREGADDEGEIGAMHPLHQPQREANLRLRLDEYLRFGLRAGLLHVT